MLQRWAWMGGAIWVTTGCGAERATGFTDPGPPPADADTDSDADADTDSDADADADADADTAETGIEETADTAVDPIPDPYAPLVVDQCDGGPAINNSTIWYVGDFTVSGNTFSGTETAAMHFSDNLWMECSYDPDCVVVYTITGQVGPAANCGSCEFGMQVDAQIDPVLTTCPSERISDAGGNSFTTSYDVAKLPTGESQVYYSSSSTLLGGWFWDGDRVVYVSELPVCWAYPDALGSVCP